MAHLTAPVEAEDSKGYSSAPHGSADASEWVELDLGEETTLSKIILMPRTDTASVSGGIAGFPRDFRVELAKQPGVYKTVASFDKCVAPGQEGLTVDLYTVIGYPVVRYIRITATRLGAPARDEPANYRLQLRRIRLLRP